MAIYKRGKVYWYKFMWQGKLIRESTKQGNDKVARQMEGAHRTSLAKGEGGIRERKTSPSLVEFMSHTFQPWVEATFARSHAPRSGIVVASAGFPNFRFSRKLDSARSLQRRCTHTSSRGKRT